MEKKIFLADKLIIKSTNINIFRFIAALLVIFSHSYYVAQSIEDPMSVFSNGQINFGGIAVAFFFFLSGMYVTKSIMSSDGKSADYMKKRCKRIFPQLWTVVLISVFIIGPLCTEYTAPDYFSDINTYKYLLNGALIPVHILPGVFTHNIYITTFNGPLWTMPVEFLGYIVILITYNISIRKQIWIFKFNNIFWIIFGGLLFSLLCSTYILNNIFLVNVIRAMMFFVIGVLYYCYKDRIVLSVPIAVVLLLLSVVALKLPLCNFILLLTFPYIIVTFGLAIRQVRYNWKILLCSYEMYLIGWPIQQIITMLWGGHMPIYLNWLITIPIDIIIAFIIYIIIEHINKKKLILQKK